VGSDKNMQQRRCATCGHGDGNHLDDGCHRDASRCPCKAFVDSGFTAEAFQEYERVYARLAAAEAERDALWERTRNVVRERDEARALLAIPATLDDVLRTEAEMGQVNLPAALSEPPDFGGHRLRAMQAKLREACGEPCAGEDEADAAIGLLRVTRGQRDDAWKMERDAQAALRAALSRVAHLTEALGLLQEVDRAWREGNLEDGLPIERIRALLLDAGRSAIPAGGER
jgi:hypothetical protein